MPMNNSPYWNNTLRPLSWGCCCLLFWLSSTWGRRWGGLITFRIILCVCCWLIPFLPVLMSRWMSSGWSFSMVCSAVRRGCSYSSFCRNRMTITSLFLSESLTSLWADSSSHLDPSSSHSQYSDTLSSVDKPGNLAHLRGPSSPFFTSAIITQHTKALSSQCVQTRFRWSSSFHSLYCSQFACIAACWYQSFVRMSGTNDSPK